MPDELYPESVTETGPGKVAELMPYEVPFRVLAAAGLLIVLIFSVAVVFAIFVQVPETVRAPFVLVPEDRADPIVAVRGGIVEELSIQEGNIVETGDVLVSIRSDEVRDWRTELELLEQDFTALDDRRGASEEIFENKLEEAQNTIREREGNVGFQSEFLKAYQDVANRTEEMKKAGMVSEVELLSRRLGLAEARRDLSLAQQAAETARLQKNLLETERVSEIKLEDIERDKLLSRMNTLRGLLEDSAGDVMFIRAPYDGVVLSTPRQRSGDPVVSGEELCQIARIDAEPRARLSIPEKDYPKLRLDHSAKLYLDAFPYQRYGTIAGRLEWLSPSAVVTEAGPEFVGYIGLDRFTISAKGEPAPLSVGMSGVARVTVGKRTLIEYAFEPLRQLRENFTPASSTSPPSVDALPYVEIETGSSEPAQPEGGAQ